MAYLTVDPDTIQGAIKFLDSVQAESGAKYGYTGPGAGQATTAIGLLCRMYLGWKKDNPAHCSAASSILDQHRPLEAATCTTTTTPRRSCGTTAASPAAKATRSGTSGTRRCATSWSTAQDKNGHQKGSWIMKGRSRLRSRRPRLLHVDGHDDPRSLLPPHADLRQGRGGRRFPAVGCGRHWRQSQPCLLTYTCAPARAHGVSLPIAGSDFTGADELCGPIGCGGVARIWRRSP